MSKRSKYESIEIMRHKISMSQKIAEKDSEYGRYAGASYEQSETMTLIDWIIEEGFFEDTGILKQFRSLLEKRKKAHLAVFGSEITKLGFLLGSPYVPKSAIKQ